MAVNGHHSGMQRVKTRRPHETVGTRTTYRRWLIRLFPPLLAEFGLGALRSSRTGAAHPALQVRSAWETPPPPHKHFSSSTSAHTPTIAPMGVWAWVLRAGS